MTSDEVKEALLQHVKEWLDEPGNSTKLTIEIGVGLNPQTRHPVRTFVIKAEAQIVQATAALPPPAVVGVNGALPPGSLPPPPGGPRNDH